MLTVGDQRTRPTRGATEATVFGPFFVDDSPEIPIGGDIAEGAQGRAVLGRGHGHRHRRHPVPGARIEVWEADDDGFYDVQHAEAPSGPRPPQRRRRAATRFWSVAPAPLPDPRRRPRRRPARGGRPQPVPARAHPFHGHRAGPATLVTHVFVAGDPYLDSDAVFGVKASLILDFAEQPPAGPATGTPGPGRDRCDVALAPTRPDDLATVRRARRMSEHSTTDVLVVGSGPAGAAAALFLATLRRRPHRDHQVPLDGEHAARAHHQPADDGDPARPRHRGRHRSPTARRSA